MATQEPRLKPSGLNSHFDFKGNDFVDYIDHCRKKIALGRLDLNEANSELIINANSPFEFIPTLNPETTSSNGLYKKGVLLIHGLLDSPFTMINVAEYFKQKGFFVRAILLPGHGTVPGDLIEVNREEWRKAVNFGIQSFNGLVEELHIAALSTGAALGIEAAFQGAPIKSIIAFSPAFQIHPIIVNINLITRGVRKLVWNFFPIFKWFNIMPDDDYSKYESIAFNAAEQLYECTKEFSKLINKSLPIPLFFSLTMDDEIINPIPSLNFFQNQTNKKNRLIVFGEKSNEINDERIVYFPGQIPEKRIVNIAHNCIPVSPNHPHYGANGDYQPLYDPVRFSGIPFKNNATKEIYLGAMSIPNIRRYTMRRLTYNPYFGEIINKLDEFLK